MKKCKIKNQLHLLRTARFELISNLENFKREAELGLQELKKADQLISHYEYLLENPHLERFLEDTPCQKKKSNNCKKK